MFDYSLPSNHCPFPPLPILKSRARKHTRVPPVPGACLILLVRINCSCLPFQGIKCCLQSSVAHHWLSFQLVQKLSSPLTICYSYCSEKTRYPSKVALFRNHSLTLIDPNQSFLGSAAASNLARCVLCSPGHHRRETSDSDGIRVHMIESELFVGIIQLHGRTCESPSSILQ